MRYFFSLIFFLSTCLNLVGQSKSVFSAKTLIPPSPNVGSLLKFIENPVSQFTGLPQISIPIFTIETGKIKLPISLSYNAGGVKVTEAASWVGMSWRLNAGGVVSQSARGNKDDAQHGRFNTTPLTMNNILNPTLCDLKAIADGLSDSEPDIFSFSFNGKSGQFYMDDSKAIVQIPEQKLKIEVIASGNPPSYTIGSWKITNIDGTQYFFTAVETLMSLGRVLNGTELLGDGEIGNYPQEAQKSWMLAKILQTDGREINFIYEDYGSTDYIFSSEYKEFGEYGESGACFSVPGYESPKMGGVNFQKQSVTTGKRLKTITFSEGKIEFVTGGNRCDLYGDKFLDKIVVYNYKNEKTKEIDLIYKYYVGTTIYTTGDLNCSSNAFPDIPHSTAAYNYFKDRRLFLTGIDELDGLGVKVGSYTFEYENSIGLPNRFSAQQDWWGYYNGNGYTSLLQNIFQTTQTMDNIKRYTVYGRNPSLNHAKQGNLKKITYPTGGYSEFEYELNSLSTTIAPTSMLHEQIIYAASGNSSGTFLGNIVVNDVSGSALIPFIVDKCVFGTTANSLVGFYITDMSNNVIISGSQVLTALQSASGGEISFSLNTGQYKIYSYAYLPFPCNYNITIKRWVDQPPALDNYDVGGLRIKKITSFDPVDSKTIQKSYVYTELINGVQKSTGINSTPFANFRNEYITWKFYCLSDCGMACKTEHTDRTLVLNSSTNYPLGTNQGGSIGYSKVIEKIIDQSSNDLGYTLYQYTNVQDGFNGASPIFAGSSSLSGNDKYPWEPAQNNSWLRGKPLRIEQYVNNGGGSYALVKKQIFTYSNLILNIPSTKAFTVNYTLNSQHPNMLYSCPIGNSMPQYSGFRYIQYQLYTGCEVLASSVTEEKDALNNPISITTTYQYNADNLLPSSVTTTHSQTGTTIQTFKYPKDYASITATDAISAGVKALQNAYALDKPIEQRIEKVINNVNQGTVNVVFNSYKAANLEPDKIFSADLTSPVSAFTVSGVTSGAVTKDSRYQERVSYNQYDANANLLEQQKTNDLLLSYVWDYNNSYPVAEVTNAPRSSIAFTSFESTGKGEWTFSGTPVTEITAPTGGYAYNLTAGSITKPVTSSTVYIISYWRPSTLAALTISGTQSGYPVTGRIVNGWKYFEHKVTGVSTVTLGGTGLIDEVRLYPSAAHMKTFTYKPLMGITSTCDENNRILYYEYDAFARLRFIRDQDRNIVKQVCYNYAGQPENCTIYQNVDKSGSYTRDNCGTGFSGSSVNVTIPAGSFTSTISVTDANNQATAYGHQQANLLGSCTSSLIDFRYTNSVLNPFVVTLTNVATSQTYTFSLLPMQTAPTVATQIIPGYYNVSIQPAGGGGTLRNYQIGSYFTSSAASTVTASNIYFNCGTCTSIQIY